jgi:hypothetical protein
MLPSRKSRAYSVSSNFLDVIGVTGSITNKCFLYSNNEPYRPLKIKILTLKDSTLSTTK